MESLEALYDAMYGPAGTCGPAVSFHGYRFAQSTYFLSRYGFDIDTLQTTLSLSGTQDNGSAPVGRETFMKISREAD